MGEADEGGEGGGRVPLHQQGFRRVEDEGEDVEAQLGDVGETAGDERQPDAQRRCAEFQRWVSLAERRSQGGGDPGPQAGKTVRQAAERNRRPLESVGQGSAATEAGRAGRKAATAHQP